MTSREPRILIVHNDLLCGQSLRDKLSSLCGTAVVDIVTAPLAALARLGDRGPDVLLIYWNLPPADALGLARMSADIRPETRVVLFGVGEAALEREHRPPGCDEVVLRVEGYPQLLAAIGRVLPGGPSRGPAAGPPAGGGELNGPAPASPRLPGVAGLTVRQRQILDLIELGLSNKEIAHRLSLSLHTVKNHIHAMLAKLEVESRHAAAEIAGQSSRARGVEPGAVASPRTGAV
jgi:DNA-binding NarL/FixJ family response regulator